MIELLSTLFVTTPGTSLHLDGDAIRVRHPDLTGRRLIPLLRIDHVVAWNGVDVSNDLIHRCAADGRSITWLSRNGRFLARSSGPQHGSPHLRLAQYLCAATERADDLVIDDVDDEGVKMPHRGGADGAGIVLVAR